MKLGRAVRTRLGRFEVPVSHFYRSRFIDLHACVAALASATDARRILEIGCGDGQLAGPLLAAFPDASYEGIDVAADVGRLFRGDADRASFRSIDSRTFVASGRGTYDLVLLVDVLHHVSVPDRQAVLEDARQLTTPGGSYALKEWIRSRTPIHLAAWASDRLLTGDRVRYFDEAELRDLISDLAPEDSEILTARIPPRANNLLLVYRRSVA